MARVVEGKVQEVSSRPWKDQRRNTTVTLHSFKLEGGDQWFRTGTTPIPAGVGQSVKFEVEGVNVDMKTFSVVQNTVETAPAPSAGPSTTNTRTASTSARAGAGTRDEYWANKEARDLEKEARYQAVNEPRMALSVAVEAASRIVGEAIKADALGFGTAAKGKRLGILTSFVKETALELADFITNAPNELEEYRKTKPQSSPTPKEEGE